VNPSAGGVDEHGGRAVDYVAGGQQLVAGLQEVFQFAGAPLGQATVDCEYGTDRDVGVDVRRAIQRIEHEYIGVLFGRVGRQAHDLLFLLGRHPGHRRQPLQGVHHHFLGQDVQLLLLLALNVHRTPGTQYVHQAGSLHLGLYDLGCHPDASEYVGEKSPALRVQVLLIGDETLQCHKTMKFVNP
jgi:hypothetical protein